MHSPPIQTPSMMHNCLYLCQAEEAQITHTPDLPKASVATTSVAHFQPLQWLAPLLASTQYTECAIHFVCVWHLQPVNEAVSMYLHCSSAPHSDHRDSGGVQ